MTDGFIQVGNQYVRLDSVTRLVQENVAGTPGVRRYFLHLVDGGFIPLSELEYSTVKRALMPPASAKLRKRVKEAS